MIFEVCVDSVEGVIAARDGGAQRVELCADLVEGGVTPSPGTIELACRQGLPVHVLVRPRGGDFIYTDLEVEVIRRDIAAAKAAGASGVVLGGLLPEGEIDTLRMREWAALARPMSVTFHRAFDLCRDPESALEALIGLGIERVLTSGGRPSALEGAVMIARLVRKAAGRIVVMAGGGITAQNLPAIKTGTGVNEVHFSARRALPSLMRFRIQGVYMGKLYEPDEYNRMATEASLVRRVVEAK
jgi:copper homeostasis protein